MRNFLVLTMLLILSVPARVFAGPATRPDWQPWSDDVFAQAKKENKFVLLDLHAVWCHWCHVMDDTTYSDPAVIGLIGKKYIAVGVDADSRPDLANRYEDYGWPATIVFGPDGKEIVKRRGYIPPAAMASMLQAIIDDPTPGPSVVAEEKITFTNDTSLSESVRKQLLQRLTDTYDNKFGSWGTVQKFMDWDGVEWCLGQARAGDKDAERMATQTLAGQRNLIDPVWGGVYQYSTDGDWMHPHFEKIMQFQAENLRTFALAYAQFHDADDLKSAQAIHGYVTKFLMSPEGAFYTSQDADPKPGEHGGEYFKLDDAGRRAQGIPRIDQHEYARENGWMIAGLTQLFDATGDRSALDEATKSAQWVMSHRDLPGGGFRHDEHDAAGPFLGDTLAMGRGFLCLYESTADRAWLTRAADAAEFIRGHFQRADLPGIATSDLHVHQSFEPGIELDENVAVARWANLLSNYTGKKSDRDLAMSAMKYLATPQVALSRRMMVAGILLADAEISSPPLHIVIVGGKADEPAEKLFATALAIPGSYKRLEWFDRAEGPLANADVEYPELPKSAAFLCNGTACSRPAFKPEDLIAVYERSQKR